MNPEEKKWFLMQSELVTGPFSQNELEERSSDLTDSLIWGRGLKEWVRLQQWRGSVTEMGKQQSAKSETQERQWVIRVKDKNLDPMSYAAMLDFLRMQSDISTIYVWTEGYSEWREVFQIHKIIDDLGISRRKHPRVPIAGSLVCERNNGTFEALLLSISEGGLGATGAPPVAIGDQFKATIKSSNLYSTITCTVEVVYAGTDGYIGLKYIGINPESLSSVIEYVRKFVESNNVPPQGT